MRMLKKIIVFPIISFIYMIALLFYKKKYLTGKYFKRNQMTQGWFWLLKYLFIQKIIGFNRSVPWIVHPSVQIGNYRNIEFDMNDLENFQSVGCYYQAIGAKIVIGKGTKIAPNVGFITANHDKNDITKSAIGKDIIIGEDCWIGMNSVILPGVSLGSKTIVGAGSIVTKSFKDGNVVIVGNPARPIGERKST